MLQLSRQLDGILSVSDQMMTHSGATSPSRPYSPNSISTDQSLDPIRLGNCSNSGFGGPVLTNTITTFNSDMSSNSVHPISQISLTTCNLTQNTIIKELQVCLGLVILFYFNVLHILIKKNIVLA